MREALMRDGQRIIAALYNDRELLPDNEPPGALESLHRDRIRTVYPGKITSHLLRLAGGRLGLRWARITVRTV